MRVAVGCDHGGLALKDVLCGVLKSAGVEVLDMGTGNEESVDYPDFAAKVARAVTSGDAERGLAICGTGIGMSIALNKFPGIRAALCHDSFTARLSRQHNDANILVLGGRVLGQEVAADMVKQWLATPFEGGRHQRRLDKITQIEMDVCKGK